LAFLGSAVTVVKCAVVWIRTTEVTPIVVITRLYFIRYIRWLIRERITTVAMVVITITFVDS
jgi:hypothetical protein